MQTLPERRRAATTSGPVDPPTKGPWLPHIGVLSLVPDQWGGPWMPREHVLTRLAKYFNVVWVDPAVGWREHWLPGHRRPRGAINPALHTSDGFVLYRPSRWLPEMYRPRALARWLTRARLRQAQRRL